MAGVRLFRTIQWRGPVAVLRHMAPDPISRALTWITGKGSPCCTGRRANHNGYYAGYRRLSGGALQSVGQGLSKVRPGGNALG